MLHEVCGLNNLFMVFVVSVGRLSLCIVGRSDRRLLLSGLFTSPVHISVSTCIIFSSLRCFVISAGSQRLLVLSKSRSAYVLCNRDNTVFVLVSLGYFLSLGLIKVAPA